MVPTPYNYKQASAGSLRSLVGRASESLTLELKRDAPQRPEKWSEQVIGFANAAGGCIILGAAERDGLVEAVDGVATKGLDDSLLQITQHVRSECEPPLQFDAHRVDMGNDREVVIFAVPPSPYRPHRRKLDRRFFLRRPAGVIEMTYLEIEQAFRNAAGEELLVQQDHARRVQAAKPDRAWLVLSVHPVPFRETRCNFAHDSASSHVRESGLSSVGGGLHIGHCHEGMVLSSAHDTVEIRVLRNGGVCAWFSAERERSFEFAGAPRVLQLYDVLKHLVAILTGYGRLAGRIGVTPPLCAALSLVGGKGLAFRHTEEDAFVRPAVIDVPVVDFPFIFLNALPVDPRATLLTVQPWLDQWWQTSGRARCPLFDAPGILNECECSHLYG